MNVCDKKKPDFPNVQCVIDEINQTGEQAASNVREGYQEKFDTSVVPITEPCYKAGFCPVNIHLGAEHLSVGQYDETGSKPSGLNHRCKLAGEERLGLQCKYYDESDPPKSAEPYEWNHCDSSMEVGQTHEVHWPHSAAGACGTLNQHQTLFCTDGVLTDAAAQIVVQAQVFTIVNDESYYYPNLTRGMIVDGNKGSDVAYATTRLDHGHHTQ